MSRTSPMRPINKYCFEANQKVSSSLRWSGIGIFTCLLAHYVGLSPARAAASAAYCTGVHRTAAGTAMDMHLHFLTAVSNWKALSCPCERIPGFFLSDHSLFLVAHRTLLVPNPLLYPEIAIP